MVIDALRTLRDDAAKLIEEQDGKYKAGFKDGWDGCLEALAQYEYQTIIEKLADIRKTIKVERDSTDDMIHQVEADISKIEQIESNPPLEQDNYNHDPNV